MKNKLKGFLLAESCIALMIAALCLTMINICVGQSQKVEKQLEKKSDQAYAEKMIKDHNLEQIMVHDHIYRKGDL